jgi:hypothetical protein
MMNNSANAYKYGYVKSFKYCNGYIYGLCTTRLIFDSPKCCLCRIFSDKEITMNSRIIYPTDDGVSVIIPAAECGLTIEEIAAKDVPAGKPYKIVDVADIPSDRTFRNAWEYTA